MLSNDTFFSIFSKNVSNYQHKVKFYYHDYDTPYMFDDKTIPKQFLYVNLTNITHHDISHIFLNNINNSSANTTNISICLEPDNWHHDWGLGSFMKRYQNNNLTYNIVTDGKLTGYLYDLNRISKYKDILKLKKSKDPRFKDTMARIPSFNVWLREPHDIDKYSTLFNKVYHLEPDTVFEMIVNSTIRDKIHFVDGRGGARYHGDGVLFKSEVDSKFVNETITYAAEIMDRIGSNMVNYLQNKSHVIFFCDHSHSRGPSTARAYIHHLRPIFPYSTQKVCVLEGGMKQWNWRWNRKLQQFYQSQHLPAAEL